LPAPNPADATVTRRIILFEGTDPLGRLMTMMGPVDPVGAAQGTLFYKDPPTETPRVGTTEIWEFYNATVDAHPLHMHLVDFRVLDRQAFIGTVQPKLMTGGYNGGTLLPASIVKQGPLLPTPDWESGRKDTVTMFPGQVTRILMSFNRPGKYVYHCHILSHEDHEMMRPYVVS
jgi:spore coat protein A